MDRPMSLCHCPTSSAQCWDRERRSCLRSRCGYRAKPDAGGLDDEVACACYWAEDREVSCDRRALHLTRDDAIRVHCDESLRVSHSRHCLCCGAQFSFEQWEGRSVTEDILEVSHASRGIIVAFTEEKPDRTRCVLCHAVGIGRDGDIPERILAQIPKLGVKQQGVHQSCSNASTRAASYYMAFTAAETITEYSTPSNMSGA